MFHFHSDDTLFAIFGGGVDKSLTNVFFSWFSICTGFMKKGIRRQMVRIRSQE